MKLHVPIVGAAFVSCFFIFLSSTAVAQVAMRTGFVEVTVAECGAYGSDMPVPGGFHPTMPDGRLSIVVDAGKNGWNDAVDPSPFCGDYFIPGSVVEGFQYKIDNYPVRANGNRGFGACEAADITRSFQGVYNYAPANAKVAVWKGTDSLSGLDLIQRSAIFEGELFMITWTQICNNSGFDWDTLYFGRNADPDQDFAWGGGFATDIRIFEQPPASAGAYMGIRGKGPGCILGLLSKDTRARVSYGGFNDTDPEDYWKGNAFYSIAGSTTADISGQLTFRETGLNNGDCTCFAMAHTFSPGAAGRAAKLTTLPCDIIPEPGAPLDPRLAAALEPESNEAAPLTRLQLSPNPASSHTYLQVEGGGAGHLHLYDAMGRLVLSRGVDDLAGAWIVLDGRPAGMYLVVVDRQSDAGLNISAQRFTQQLVIE